LVDELLKGGLIIGKTIVMDATFIKAYSKRDPHENSRGGSLIPRLEWVGTAKLSNLATSCMLQ
jgi:hypothetical protein